MRLDDVDEVGAVERLCFPNPWPLAAYRRELRNPEQNYYIVLRDDPTAEHHEIDHGSPNGEYTLQSPRFPLRRPRRFTFWPLGRRKDEDSHPPIIGFAGMWNVLDESHVTTIGLVPQLRGRNLGELLFVALIDEAIRRRVTWVTLEVRVSNHSAQSLYRKYGFTVRGRRPRYYSDNNEDAYIMWSGSLKDASYQERLEELRRKLAHRMSFDQEPGQP